MKKRKEIRDKVLDMHQTEKGYKITSKCSDIPLSTIGSMVRKWKLHHTSHALPRQVCSSKFSIRARRGLVKETIDRPTRSYRVQRLRLEWRRTKRWYWELCIQLTSMEGWIEGIHYWSKNTSKQIWNVGSGFVARWSKSWAFCPKFKTLCVVQT